MSGQSRFGHSRQRWQFDSKAEIIRARPSWVVGHSTGPIGGLSSSKALMVGRTFFRQQAVDPKGSRLVRCASRNLASPTEIICNARGVSHNGWTFILKPPGSCVPKWNANTRRTVRNGTPQVFLEHSEWVNGVALERSSGRRIKALPTVGTPDRRPTSFQQGGAAVARQPHKLKVAGSNLASASSFHRDAEGER
jgi:hypothetical protein